MVAKLEEAGTGYQPIKTHQMEDKQGTLSIYGRTKRHWLYL